MRRLVARTRCAYADAEPCPSSCLNQVQLRSLVPFFKLKPKPCICKPRCSPVRHRPWEMETDVSDVKFQCEKDGQGIIPHPILMIPLHQTKVLLDHDSPHIPHPSSQARDSWILPQCSASLNSTTPTWN